MSNNSTVPITSLSSSPSSSLHSSSVGSPSSASSVSSPSQVVSTVTGPSQAPSSTVRLTSVVLTTNSAQSTPNTVTVVSTSFFTPSTTPAKSTKAATTSSAPATSSTPASLTTNGSSNSSGGGLSPAGVTAVAVVVPVVVVALLVLGGIFWWRKRKQKKTAQEARRKEVEEYGYNPNEDPTLPAVAGAGSESPEMSEATGGYRGWGNNAAGSSARKPSTNLSSGIGMAVSDDGQHPSSGSPGQNTASDGGHSADPLVDGAVGTGAAAVAGGTATHYGQEDHAKEGVQRGPSNASSSYSAAGHTDNSDEPPAGDCGYDTNYSQYAPYRPGATQYEDTSQPVIRDVSARRNTKIENPSVLPKQGNSGISQNF